MRYKKLGEGDGWLMKKKMKERCAASVTALYRPPGALAPPCCSSPNTMKATKWAALTKKEYEVTVKRHSVCNLRDHSAEVPGQEVILHLGNVKWKSNE